MHRQHVPLSHLAAACPQVMIGAGNIPAHPPTMPFIRPATAASLGPTPAPHAVATGCTFSQHAATLFGECSQIAPNLQAQHDHNNTAHCIPGGGVDEGGGDGSQWHRAGLFCLSEANWVGDQLPFSPNAGGTLIGAN